MSSRVFWVFGEVVELHWYMVLVIHFARGFRGNEGAGEKGTIECQSMY